VMSRVVVTVTDCSSARLFPIVAMMAPNAPGGMPMGGMPYRGMNRVES
jgi:hypothetical protein